MSETLPAQIETDSSMMFIAAKAGDGEARSSHRPARLSSASTRSRRERMGVIAERGEVSD